MACGINSVALAHQAVPLALQKRIIHQAFLSGASAFAPENWATWSSQIQPLSKEWVTRPPLPGKLKALRNLPCSPYNTQFFLLTDLQKISEIRFYLYSKLNICLNIYFWNRLPLSFLGYFYSVNKLFDHWANGYLLRFSNMRREERAVSRWMTPRKEATGRISRECQQGETEVGAITTVLNQAHFSRCLRERKEERKVQ